MGDGFLAPWRGRRIEDRQLSAHGNNFNAVRLVLASGVIWTHCYWRVIGAVDRDDISPIIGATISHLAVNGFFFVSGFLVCQSLFRQPGPLRFAAMRFGRIWPGLAVCLLLTTAIFALTSGRPLAFLGEMETLRFLAMNLTQIRAHYALPAISAEGGALVVNGSLWTIPWELRCYVVLALTYAVAAGARQRALAVLAMGSIAGCALWILTRELVPGFPDTSAGLLYNVNVWARLWGCFSAGVAAALWWRRIVVAPLALVPIWLAVIAEYQLAGTSLLVSPATFYTVLVAAFAQRADRAATADWHDFSYGIYIYAYPVMVLVYHVWPTTSFRLLALANFAGTLPLAALSWLLIEKPALRGIKRFFKARSARSSRTVGAVS